MITDLLMFEAKPALPRLMLFWLVTLLQSSAILYTVPLILGQVCIILLQIEQGQTREICRFIFETFLYNRTMAMNHVYTVDT